MIEEKNKQINSILRDCENALTNLTANLETINSISLAADRIIKSLESGSKIFACGNGGSMADSMHFCEELSGKFRKDRKGLAAISISDPCYLTCVANDYGYENVFSRFLESNAKGGDILFAISTSGSSLNILNAARYAKQNSINVITLTGKVNSELSKESDIDICTPYGNYSDRVQELHIKVIHILVEIIERSFFPDNYK